MLARKKLENFASSFLLIKPNLLYRSNTFFFLPMVISYETVILIVTASAVISVASFFLGVIVITCGFFAASVDNAGSNFNTRSAAFRSVVVVVIAVLFASARVY